MNDMMNDILNTMVDNFYKDNPVIDTNRDSVQTYEDELCACGVPLNECPDAYDHITHGVWYDTLQTSRRFTTSKF